MFDNRILNKGSSVYKDLDMSSEYTVLNWIKANPNNGFFPSERHVFPLGEPKIKEEISFYKDICGVDLT